MKGKSEPNHVTSSASYSFLSANTNSALNFFDPGNKVRHLYILSIHKQLLGGVLEISQNSLKIPVPESFF